MEKKYFVSEKSGNTFEIHPTCYSLSENNIIAQYYFLQKKEWVLFEIGHNDIQTQMDLSNVPDYVFVFLESNDNNWNVVGATHCLNKNEGAFGILTPHKKILCIPHEALIDINKLAFVTCVQTQSLPTWSSELAKIEQHIFVFFKLGVHNLVLNHHSIRACNIQNHLKEYYEIADFDNDIFLLTNSKCSKMELYEIVKDILIPNGLKENIDYCLLDSYVVTNNNIYNQHPDCILNSWLSGYFHPSSDKFSEGNYIHFAKNNLIKRIVFMFYNYMKTNHYQALKKGVKVFLIKDGYLYFGLEQQSNPELKISLLNIINENYTEYIQNNGFEYIYCDSLEKYRAYCKNLNDEELLNFYNHEIHKRKVRENGRYLFINVIKEEIKSRTFESSVLDMITKAGVFHPNFYEKIELNRERELVLIGNKDFKYYLPGQLLSDYIKWLKDNEENNQNLNNN